VPFEAPQASPVMRMIFVMGGRLGDATPLVSVVTPSLLFEDLTLKRPSGEIPTPPVAAHPAFAGE
jgi:hypothetical protein